MTTDIYWQTDRDRRCNAATWLHWRRGPKFETWSYDTNWKQTWTPGIQQRSLTCITGLLKCLQAALQYFTVGKSSKTIQSSSTSIHGKDSLKIHNADSRLLYALIEFPLLPSHWLILSIPRMCPSTRRIQIQFVYNCQNVLNCSRSTPGCSQSWEGGMWDKGVAVHGAIVTYWGNFTVWTTKSDVDVLVIQPPK